MTTTCMWCGYEIAPLTDRWVTDARWKHTHPATHRGIGSLYCDTDGTGVRKAEPLFVIVEQP